MRKMAPPMGRTGQKSPVGWSFSVSSVSSVSVVIASNPRKEYAASAAPADTPEMVV